MTVQVDVVTDVERLENALNALSQTICPSRQERIVKFINNFYPFIDINSIPVNLIPFFVRENFNWRDFSHIEFDDNTFLSMELKSASNILYETERERILNCFQSQDRRVYPLAAKIICKKYKEFEIHLKENEKNYSTVYNVQWIEVLWNIMLNRPELLSKFNITSEVINSNNEFAIAYLATLKLKELETFDNLNLNVLIAVLLKGKYEIEEIYNVIVNLCDNLVEERNVIFEKFIDYLMIHGINEKKYIQGISLKYSLRADLLLLIQLFLEYDNFDYLWNIFCEIDEHFYSSFEKKLRKLNISYIIDLVNSKFTDSTFTFLQFQLFVEKYHRFLPLIIEHALEINCLAGIAHEISNHYLNSFDYDIQFAVIMLYIEVNSCLPDHQLVDLDTFQKIAIITQTQFYNEFNAEIESDSDIAEAWLKRILLNSENIPVDLQLLHTALDKCPSFLNEAKRKYSNQDINLSEKNDLEEIYERDVIGYLRNLADDDTVTVCCE